MAREGQAKAPQPGSEPVNMGSGAWPTLGGPASRNDRPTPQKNSGEVFEGWDRGLFSSLMCVI